MAYRLRSVRKTAKKTRRKVLLTTLLILFIIYASLKWILPGLIGGIGFLSSLNKPVKKVERVSDQSILAPPVINIPYVATNSATIDINGYTSPDTKVELFLDDQLKNTTRSDSDGNFTFSKVDLALGTNNIYGKTLDNKNKESLPSKTIQLSFLNQKPKLNISSPPDGQTVTGGDKKITISGKTDPGTTVFINGTQIIISSDGSFNTDRSLNDGDNSFDIKAVDLATNTTQVSRKVNYKSS